MKSISFILASLMFFTSCGQIQRVLDGTEKLPADIKALNGKIDKTNKGVHLQELSQALDRMKNEKNRANLLPLPIDMMSSGKAFAEEVTAEEMILFVKSNLIKIENQQAVDSVPAIDEELFQHNRLADYYMLVMVSGFLPDAIVKTIVDTESDQGAYQDVMLAILKMRVEFNSDQMLLMSMLGLSPIEFDENKQYKVIKPTLKLDTLGKIKRAMLYNSKVEYVCNLPFVNKVGLDIPNFPALPFDKEQAKKNWKIILNRAEAEFKSVSLLGVPAENESQVAEYNKTYQKLIAELKEKSQ